MFIPILQIVGYSNSGKTTILTKLIEALKKKNYQLAVIKSARMHKMLRKAKDSGHFIESGADNVAVFFENGIKMYIPKTMSLKRLIEIISVTTEPDIILIEGFKKGTFDKILVWSEELNQDISEFNLKNLRAIYNPTDIDIKNPIITELTQNGLRVIKTTEELLKLIEKSYF